MLSLIAATTPPKRVQVAALLLALFLFGCVSDDGTEPNAAASASIVSASDQRSTEAAASISAASEINKAQPDGRKTQVIDRELALASANLPLPSAEQLKEAQERTEAALAAQTESELQQLYSDAIDKAAALEKALNEARAAAGRLEEQQAAEKEALLVQVKTTTWAAIAFMAIGLFVGFTGNQRIGVSCVVLGGVLLASMRIIASAPQWAYTTLFITAGLVAIALPVSMLYAYKTGLFQRPPESIGEFKLNQY